MSGYSLLVSRLISLSIRSPDWSRRRKSGNEGKQISDGKTYEKCHTFTVSHRKYATVDTTVKQ